LKEYISNSLEWGNLMKRTTKIWSVSGGFAFLALAAGGITGGDYLTDRIIKPPFVKCIVHTHDSISVPDKMMVRRAAMQARKTQSYLESNMSRREILRADTAWQRDSTLYAAGLEDGGNR
jgi:hypothetical protein